MIVEIAKDRDRQGVAMLDRHIPSECLYECINGGKVYVLRDDSKKDKPIVGVMRYSLFWQVIPFLDLIYIKEEYRSRGFGTMMMRVWENEMIKSGYTDVMTSTQSDEDAWKFYEELGYRRVGGFFPPGQDVEEWIYSMNFKEQS